MYLNLVSLSSFTSCPRSSLSFAWDVFCFVESPPIPRRFLTFSFDISPVDRNIFSHPTIRPLFWIFSFLSMIFHIVDDVLVEQDSGITSEFFNEHLQDFAYCLRFVTRDSFRLESKPELEPPDMRYSIFLHSHPFAVGRTFYISNSHNYCFSWWEALFVFLSEVGSFE